MTILGERLLAPASVAIVGASDDLAKTSSRPLRYMRQAGFTGKIYPINKRSATVLGEKAWPSLEDLPEVPDQVFVMSPVDSVLDVTRSCVDIGVPLMSVLSGGFGEEGAVGRQREDALRQVLAQGQTRLLGPNSIGMVNVRTGMLLTANAAFAEPRLPSGGLFVASHSGSMIGAILSRGIARGTGFAGLVSTGSELDLSLGEICEATLDDPHIDSYALFLESIAHGDALRRFAIAAAARGKPVIAYKLGRSAQAAELAQSHTGAIAGEDGIADAFLKDCGIARVETLEGLIEGAALLRRMTASPGPRAPKVAVVSTTGGGAAMVVDQLGIRGIEVVPPSPRTRAELAARGIETSDAGRIVDLTLAGTRPEVMRAALDTLLAAPESDLVIAVAGSSARFQPELLVPAIVAAADAHRKPLAAFVAPEAPEALSQLSAGGIACFRTPEACGDAVAAILGRRPTKPLTPAPAPGVERQVDEAEGYRELARIGIASPPSAVISATMPESPIGYPVAVKLLSADILHKTELGGVVLNVGDATELSVAIDDIRDNVARHAPDMRVGQLLLQHMASGVGEVLISYHRDVDAGPMVMLAAGGTFAEIFMDRSLRLAPVDLDTAWAMIGEVRSMQALAGYRGKKRGDLDALARVLVAISQPGDRIVAAEINPLIIGAEGDGVVAVDAVVKVREEAE